MRSYCSNLKRDVYALPLNLIAITLSCPELHRSLGSDLSETKSDAQHLAVGRWQKNFMKGCEMFSLPKIKKNQKSEKIEKNEEFKNEKSGKF